MNKTLFISALLGTVVLISQTPLAVAQQQNAPKQQPAQQAKPVQQQTVVPAHQSAAGQLNTAAQSAGQTAKVMDGGRGTNPTPVQVQKSTGTANAATISAQQNAAERGRQAQTSQKYGIDKVKVP
jgi:hypothetical protein